MSKQSGWVTINGVHVFIDGKSGKITQGPAKFIGSTLNDLPSNKSPQADLKARLQAKKNAKSSSKVSSPANDYSSSTARELTSQERKENEKFRSNAQELGNEVFKYNVSKFSDSELSQREKVLDKRLKERTGEKIDGDWRRDFSELKDIRKELKSRNASAVNQSTPKTGNSTFDNATNTTVKNADYYHKKAMDKFIAVREVGTPKTGNSNFDNAVKSNKTMSSKASSGLSVTHYDGIGRGYWNEYRIGGKKVSAKEARAQFPNMFDDKGRYNGGKK